ncbi:MAG: GNAT family N-acetyltransferase [Pseudodesulfovibrio sp.]
MRITTADERDFPEITAVWEASVRATHHFLSEADIVFFRPLIRNEYLGAVELRCARDGANRILGFVGVAGENVEMLFLSPESRGRGLGRMLLHTAVDELGARRVDVNEQNPAALGFYRHMGFTVVGRSPVDGQGKPFPLLHLELAQAGPTPA